MGAKDWLMRAEETLMEKRYADTTALGEAMLKARMEKRAAKGSTSETRKALEYEIARLSYDMSFLLAENKIFREALDIALNMNDRLINLEKIVGENK